jgi:hypothetical protein
MKVRLVLLSCYKISYPYSLGLPPRAADLSNRDPTCATQSIYVREALADVRQV